MLVLVGRTLQFALLHLLIRIVDRISRLPRNSQPSDLERLYRENIALKAQLEAMRKEIKNKVGRRPQLSLRTRAAQVFAYLLNRGNQPFTKYYLSSSKPTVEKWTTRFRRSLWFWRASEEPHPEGGRPTTADEVRTLVISLRLENPRWGVPKIQGTLREMGIKVCKSTVRNILVEEGLLPSDPQPANWDRFRSAAKDALWAIDYFVTETRTTTSGRTTPRSCSGTWTSTAPGMITSGFTMALMPARRRDTLEGKRQPRSSASRSSVTDGWCAISSLTAC